MYVNSNSEVSDLFDFVIAFEEKASFRKEQEEEEKKTNEEIHPLLKELKSKLSHYIFDFHNEQNILSYRYLINPNELNIANTDNQTICFKVKSMDSKNENHSRSVKVENGKYICECRTFVNCGIICRHIFYVSHMHQEKDLSKIQINPRWLIQDQTETSSLKQLFSEFTKKKEIIKEIEESKTSEESKQSEEKGIF